MLFSSSEPETLRHRYELDYWGTSYYEAIQAILEMDNRSEIRMSFANSSGKFNVKYRLPSELRERIVVTDEHPDYFLTEYRFHPEDYPYEPAQEVYRIEVKNNTITSVFRIE